MAGLSKSRLIAHLQCPKRLWLQMNKPELTEVDASQQSRMDAGNVVGDIARQLHPGGILIDGGSLSQALKDTEALPPPELRFKPPNPCLTTPISV